MASDHLEDGKALMGSSSLDESVKPSDEGLKHLTLIRKRMLFEMIFIGLLLIGCVIWTVVIYETKIVRLEERLDSLEKKFNLADEQLEKVKFPQVGTNTNVPVSFLF